MTIPALHPWSVVDGRTYSHRNGASLSPGDPNAFGLLCRYDLAEPCRLALTAPLDGFQLFHLLATDAGRRRVDVDRSERLLGWRPTVDFADLAPDQATAQP